jgi:hypothetical protein
MVTEEAMHRHCQTLSVDFENFHSKFPYGSIPTRTNVSVTGILLPWCFTAHLAVVMPCQVQLCAVYRSSLAQIFLSTIPSHKGL